MQKYEYFYKYGAYEVDFVDVNEQNILSAIEVKYKNKVSLKELNGLQHFQKKFSAQKIVHIGKTKGNFDTNIKQYLFHELPLKKT